MSNRITVTSAELHDTSTQMAAAGAQISAELRRILGRVSELTSSCFNVLYTGFNSSWSQCEENLRGIGSMLDGAAQAFDETDSMLAQSFRG
jgi:uncharacterized protein YukE